jgi:bacteriocin biosynthesis cyclodehydratase domain-containing protein
MTHVPEYPLLSPWHRIAADCGRILVEYGGEAVAFEGRAAQALLPALLPLLDGRTTVDEIVAALGHGTRPAVERALSLLAEAAMLTEGPPFDAALPRPCAAAALLHAAGNPPLSPDRTRTALQRASVRVAGSSHAAAETARALRLSGIGDVRLVDWSDPAPDALTVAAPTRRELGGLPAWNAAAVESGAEWLQILPFNGAFMAIGPLYVPGETSCYECYRRRRAANVDYPDLFWTLERSPRGPEDAPALAAAAAGIATTLSLRWLLTRDGFSAGVMLALELRQFLTVTAHVVYRVPRCPACTGADRVAKPLPWAEAS